MLKLVERFRVRGDSMLPTLSDGVVVTALRVPSVFLRAGMVVVAEVEPDVHVVKRIAAKTSRNTVSLSSDNDTTTSVYCGVDIKTQRVSGVVIHATRPRVQASPNSAT
ncbi:MAG: S24/S26 family peptidase [Pseudomonadota bacterium]